MAGLVRIRIAGWTQCGFFQRTVKIGAAMQLLHPKKIETTTIELPDRDHYRAWLAEEKPKLQLDGGDSHTSSPLVWLNENQYLGGADAFAAWVKKELMGPPAPKKAEGSPQNKPDGVTKDHGYQYDLVCIGGGSGGLAASKAAADLGANVACLDYVKPSPQGTKWGLGGTCVNVGCIPKKLCHRAAIIGEEIHHDSKPFGWKVEGVTHDWANMLESIHDYISGLNFKYRVSLRDKKVKYINKLGRIIDEHTIELTDKKGKTETITTARMIIAVGGRPSPLDIPGGEHIIDSDDVFQMDWESREGSKNPGKNLVVGASYVALECAGFFTALGYDTSVMVRSILLRGFDREYADKIGEYMEQTGTKFVRGTVPTRIEKQDDGKLKVFWNIDGVEHSDVYDTVVAAIGRFADTKKLGVENVGIKCAPNGKIICADNNEQTNVPNIYAIGDVVQGMQELTPVAIQSGQMLASRLYGTNKSTMDYDFIPTTVFTPIEYGACGLSEETAIERYGADDIEVYHKELAPLEWEMVEKPVGIARCKLVCVKSEDMRVVGLHVLAPNSGEITQGFALGMRKGATYQDFRDVVGIHPTVAEDFTTLTVTKSSGESAASTGC